MNYTDFKNLFLNETNNTLNPDKTSKSRIKSFYPNEWLEVHFKTYPRFKSIKLSKYRPLSLIESSLLKRRSTRKFNNRLSLDELSRILYFSASTQNPDGDATNLRRTYPSAGGRYPLELYLVSNKVTGLEDGLYHYSTYNNALEILSASRPIEQLESVLVDKWVARAPMVIFITMINERSEIKYNNRSLRYSLIEVGHLAQNLLLTAASYSVAACPIGGFYDTQVDKYLRIDKTDERCIYIIAIG